MIKTKFISNLFTYNEFSILNKRFIRTLNYILLCICILFMYPLIDNPDLIVSSLPGFIFIGIFALSIINSIIVYLKLNSIEFFEWDYTERKKKGRVSGALILITTIFSSFLILSSILFINKTYIYIYGKFNLLCTVVNFITPLLMLVNLIKSFELHYFLFEDNLKTAYKIQKKPEGWISDGVEVNPNNEIKEIMFRDFGV